MTQRSPFLYYKTLYRKIFDLNNPTILPLLICLVISSSLLAQNGKPINEILGYSEGCPLPAPSKVDNSNNTLEAPEMIDMEVAMEVAPPPPPPAPAEAPRPAEEIPPMPSEKELLQSFSSFLKAKKFKKPELTFEENKFVQDENLNWMLVSESGKKLTDTKFELIQISYNKENPGFAAKESGKEGFNVYDKSGKPYFKKNFQYINPVIRDEYVYFYLGNKMGVANINGKIVLPAKYEYVQKLENGWLIKSGELRGVLNKKGKEIIPIKYEKLKIAYSNDQHIWCFIQENNGELTILKNGKTFQRLGIKYDAYGEARIFDGRYLFYNNKLIDLNEKKLLTCGEKVKIEKHNTFYKLYSVTDKKYQHWYFNEQGKVIGDLPGSSKAYRVRSKDDLAIINFKTGQKDVLGFPVFKSGLIDKEMNWKIEPKYAGLTSIKDTEYYIAKNNQNKYGVIDVNEKTILPFEYRSIQNLGKVLLTFKIPKSTLAEVMDLEGKKLFDANLDFKHLRANSVGYEANRTSDRKRVMLNDRFEVIYDKGFNNKGPFGKDAIWVDKFGNHGKTYNAFDYQGNPYPVKINGEARTDYKLINKIHRTPYFFLQMSDDLKVFYNPNTKMTYPVSNKLNHLGDGLYKYHGLIAANKKYREDMGIIDSLGNEILPPVFKKVSAHPNLISIQGEKKNIIFNNKGERLFKDYDTAYYLFGQYFMVRKNGKTGIANLKGDIIIPVKYKKVAKSGIWEFQVTETSGKKHIFGVDGKKRK